MKKVICAALIASVGFVYACSSDDDHSHSETGGHTSPFASCQTIIDACHELDVGEGPIHDCHEIGHDATEATGDGECVAKKDECLKTCVADAGTADSGASDGSADAAHE
ncbi:hypothetical protein [Labilithrix luteola]|nr:hypothetical protein [Labilithrix luteola]